MNPPPAGADLSPQGRPVCEAAFRGWTRPFSARESLSARPLQLPPPPCPHLPAQKNTISRANKARRRVRPQYLPHTCPQSDSVSLHVQQMFFFFNRKCISTRSWNNGNDTSINISVPPETFSLQQIAIPIVKRKIYIKHMNQIQQNGMCLCHSVLNSN